MTSDNTIIISDEEYEQQVDSSGDDEEFQSVDEESSSNELLLNDNESFATPKYVKESDIENTFTNINMNDFWILLWIFKYQERFRLPDIAVDSLIKFFRVVLSDTNEKRFEKFPTSAYMARKLLDIKRKLKTYVTYPECNKIYSITINQMNSECKYSYVKFLNHPMRN
ncbi:16665_t:CDS:1 [Funneliformis caledonium]|uniref:16665_t:CDS:1 n=1 Tax=Funneliformis caledonium TaxID=1117310 RepID=A0A9N9CBZ7_9GLOM|nr:16665_t:CDS:1 [Funneliformis caledonium]